MPVARFAEFRLGISRRGLDLFGAGVHRGRSVGKRLESAHLMAFGFGFNKAKVLSAAEKYVQQGKLQNAISEYEKIAKEDPKDLTALNTIGDLYARLGQSDRATAYFKRVGNIYAGDGFTVQAIAMY